MIILLLFWISVFALFHSYVLYPVAIRLLSRDKKFSHPVFSMDDELPEVIILCAVYNGERVIKEKIESALSGTYPSNKIKLIIGSDESTDRTEELIREMIQIDKRIELYRYPRRGKSNVLNSLRQEVLHKGISDSTIFILTDLHARFDKNTVFELVKHFKSPDTGIVGASYIPTNMQRKGVSIQEDNYIQGENAIKYSEGITWGSTMGIYGACYAIREIDFPEFPSNILVEDFYITMHILKMRKRSILSMESKFYLNPPDFMGIEFARKRRIAAGNFQNLFYFKSLLNPIYGGTAFAFLSHKVIRWFGPLFITLAYISNIFLLPVSQFYLFPFVVQNLLLLSPIIDSLLKRFGIHLILLRFASYFIMMNIALASGFILYMKGIKTNTWNPTDRNV